MTSIATLRGEIDAIDERLLDLLAARAGVAREVSALKGRPPYWRPAREAAILRRLAATHLGPFPLAALCEMWTHLMAATTAMEGGLRVIVAATADDRTMLDLARAYFGRTVPIDTRPDAPAALAALVGDPVAVAIVPRPQVGDARWWLELARADEPRRIVFQLPYVAGVHADDVARVRPDGVARVHPGGVARVRSDGVARVRSDGVARVRSDGVVAPRRALVVAAIAPEPTGADRSFLAVAPHAADGDPLALCAALGFAEPHLIGRGPDGAALIECAGFVAANDPRLIARGAGSDAQGAGGAVVAQGAGGAVMEGGAGGAVMEGRAGGGVMEGRAGGGVIALGAAADPLDLLAYLPQD